MPVVTLSKLNSVVVDGYISEQNPSYSELSLTTMKVGKFSVSNGFLHRGFIKFDLGLIPNDAIINSASLKMYQSLGDSTTENIEVRAHLITQDWASPTWANPPTYSGSLYGSIVLKNTTATYNYFTMDLTAIVQRWVAGQSNNYGVLLKHADESPVVQRTLSTSEDNGYYPQLIIDYTIPSTGKKQVEYVGYSESNSAGVTSHTVPLPAHQTGDLLLLQISNPANLTITAPAGWTKLSTTGVSGIYRTIFYKFAQSNAETTPVIMSSLATNWASLAHNFRNVKNVITGNVSTSAATTGINVPWSTYSATKLLRLILLANAGQQAYNPILNYDEKRDYGANSMQTMLAASYLHNQTAQTDIVATAVASTNHVATTMALEPITNNSPTLTLTSPVDNLLGTDGNCEDVSKFSVASVSASLDSVEGKYGNYALKLTSTAAAATLARSVNYPIDNKQYHLLLAEARNISMTNFSIRAEKGSNSLTIKNSPSYTTTTWGPVFVKLSPADLAGETSIKIGLVGNASAIGQQWLIDGIRLYSITQEDYDKIGVDPLYSGTELLKRFPYVDPTNNQTLSEAAASKTYAIQGSATDIDSGNVVTIKYKINNGTSRAIASGVSDGSTPINFAKNLTYSNKRLWDSSTDVVGVDLAENIDHTLTVWAEDDQGGKSADVIRKFRVVWNRPPVISGADENLGTISAAPSKNYSVTDPEGNSFTITEYLDGEVLRTFTGVAGQQYTVTISPDKWLRTSLAQHTLKVRATDSTGLYSERTYTFTRTDNSIVFQLAQPFQTDAKANRVLFTLDAVIPTGATLLVEACNNALDTTPAWENITAKVTIGRGHIFANATKTATKWGVNVRVTVTKGTATQPVIINGYGGAFD